MSVLIKGLSTEKVKHCFEFAKSGWCIFNIPEIIEIPDEPKTNADRIRSMGDVELANFLSGLSMGCVNCPMYYPEENDECIKHCNTAWQKWLKQELADKDGEV